jgi:hypothetical protein
MPVDFAVTSQPKKSDGMKPNGIRLFIKIYRG